MEIYDQEKLVRVIGERAYFTFKDVRIILTTLREVIHDLLEDGHALNWYGLFKIRPGVIPSYKGWDGFSKKEIVVPEKHRVVITPSPSLHESVVKGVEKKKREQEELNEQIH